ncbi:MAG: ShlB/FhaC/HecB family hemolysin secretion/activation protein [Thermomonas sp.]|jgi:hemolysin activation/secretion protein|nr:ShlB/FhaC/HecB family hemolysin secretion/activation protein [Thermomonas sp.]MBK6924424.1 ShlB/FhaC/HecB family hemolysin secretion/activation protein [Thermomonas sp.]MBP8615702.1 ShlB/FhaC/HecB family hemolysin secretion/activation protein [Thermomonas sp.]HQY81541.1 ShlB/FhaC/HecB family hemolysin secretion/activation protein [Thermomonas sp.]HRA01695.1 ShlB/FhaC/HecB family hemolysin secretion/activation protein [Thermomonas sp.]
MPPTNLLAAALLMACVPFAQAADGAAAQEATPAPGSAPQQAQALPEPQMAVQAQASFVLRGVQFVGATGVADSELQAAVADRIGTSVTFADLEQLAARAVAVYQKRGFGLVQAYVPVQEVVDGVVRISISEGVLGNVSIELAEGVPVAQERVAGTLAILEPGKPLNGRQYERAMLLLSDLPGIKPQSAISAGAATGTTDLVVQVGERDRLQYGLEVDNHGTSDSGRHRITGSLRWASPFGRGDNLDLRLMLAEGMHTAFGRISYETPVGYRGLRIGGGLARVQYELGGPFAPLEPTGTGNVADLSFSYPLIRQRSTNLFVRGVIDNKDLTDRFEAVGFETHKRVRGAGIGLSFERRDGLLGGGYTSANALLYRGNLDIKDATSEAFDNPPFGYDTEGSFGKATLQLARLQSLAPKFSLFLGTGMQRASKNLDAYEKLSLGGPKAVRAYATGEVLVDDGWLATVELRYAPRPDTTLFAFYDAAHGDFFHDPRPFDVFTSRSLRGHGLGLNWSRPGKLSMNFSIAWRSTDPGVTDGGDRNPRLFWSIQKAF